MFCIKLTWKYKYAESEFILQTHMRHNLLLSMIVNGGLGKTVVFVVSTITSVYGL